MGRDDMAESTGGHHLDTGAGPKPIALATGIALESKVQTAYRAYLDHRPGCAECQEPTTFQCPTAKRLWDEYRDIRA